MNSLSSEPEPKKVPWYFIKAGNSEFRLVNPNIEMINSKYLLLGDHMNVFLIHCTSNDNRGLCDEPQHCELQVWNFYVDPNLNM